MKIVKTTVVFLFLYPLIYLPCIAQNTNDITNIPRLATVKITKTFLRPNYCIPWKMNDYNSSVGSGVILDGNIILTNAHVVSDSTIIQIQKENDPNIFEAKVLFIGHECDLALLKVQDEHFFNGTAGLKLGGVPELKSIVTTYGYPVGGERISITEGVVSRIEIGVYTHSRKAALLMIQTDAAINAGNSGGPVVQDNRIVGIAFQAISGSNNIGYMIPVPVIEHFLQDISDGAYDGFPDLGIFTQDLINDSYREYLGMGNKHTGIIVTHVLQGTGAENILKKDDVLLSIDGNDIANDGSIAFGDIGRIRFSIIIDRKQINDSVQLTILRNRKILSLTVKLKQMKIRLPWFNEYETMPRYFIFAGIVFQPLNREFLKCWDKWWDNADGRMLYYFSYLDRDNILPDRDEIIVINQVLPDPANTYISNLNDLIVESINNIPIKTLDDIPVAFTKPVGGYHIISAQGSGRLIILKAPEAEEANQRILRKYGIPSEKRLSR